MGDFLLELLSSAFGGLVPKRASEIILALLMVIAALAFIALAGFVLYQGVQSGAGLRVLAPSGLFALVLGGFAALSLKFAKKGFRGGE